MNNYFIQLAMQLGEYEKSSYMIVQAENETIAQKEALENECHNEPDFSECEGAHNWCWDGGEFVYSVYECKLLTEEEYSVLNKFI